ncbi:PucC family protein [Dankookia sp. P2]|uniref:PucC family protein n=1 Tax=Dankookia sp. P2 TaxID=3423955 RepID=UPI003D66B298
MKNLGWLGILRLGLVQTALGAVVVLTTSAINRVMVVELALPATIPGLLVALHYAVQALPPGDGPMAPTAAGGGRPGSSAASWCWRSAASPPRRRRP